MIQLSHFQIRIAAATFAIGVVGLGAFILGGAL